MFFKDELCVGGFGDGWCVLVGGGGGGGGVLSGYLPFLFGGREGGKRGVGLRTGGGEVVERKGTCFFF